MDTNQEILDMREERKNKIEKARKYWFCILNNSLLFASAILMFCLFLVGFKSSFGKTIAIQNFYIFVVNMFRTNWSSISVTIGLLGDAGIAVAFLSVSITLIVKMIKAIDAFVKVCKNGYDSKTESRIKDAVSSCLKSYVIFLVLSSLFYAQTLGSLQIAFLVVTYLVILGSDFLDNFYFVKKRSYRSLIYIAVRRAVVMICYTILVNYCMQLGSVSSFFNNITYFASYSDLMIDASDVFSIITLYFVVPVFHFISQMMVLGGYGTSADYYFNDDGNFTSLIIIFSITCGVFIFGCLFAEAELSDNIFKYVYSVARRPLSAIIISVAGRVANGAYNAAMEEIREKELKERVKEQENKPVEENKEVLSVKPEIIQEDKEKEMAKQIAQAIVEAQKQAKENAETDEMAKIIAKAVGKIYESNNIQQIAENQNSPESVATESPTETQQDDNKS